MRNNSPHATSDSQLRELHEGASHEGVSLLTEARRARVRLAETELMSRAVAIAEMYEAGSMDKARLAARLSELVKQYREALAAEGISR